MNKQPKVALAHEFLTQFGGAEKTFEAIAEIYSSSPIYTAKYISKNMPESINKRKIISPKKGFVSKASKYFFTFLMAPIFEDFDFNDFDIVISDGNTWNKGILTKPHQLHVTYVHTPPRFLYGYSTESTKRDKWYFKIPFSYVDNILRLWDYVAAQRPEYILANSKEVKSRIKKFYNRDAKVIYPPVEINYKTSEPKNKIKKPYFIAVARLEKYKNFDILIKAFNSLPDETLVIVGRGQNETALKEIANENIIFVGRAPDKEKHNLIEKSLGLINPVKDEDFGIVPLEAHAHGKPVLAHRSGGHLETIIENENGSFFEELDSDKISEKVIQFKKDILSGKFDADKIKQRVEMFSKERFKKEFKDFVSTAWETFNTDNA